MKKIKKSIPFVIEKHPADYNGYPFITLLQYSQNSYLTIIDSADNEIISFYNLDICQAEGIDEKLLLEVADNWYANYKNKYPLSIELAKRSMGEYVSPIHKTINVEYVTRIIGPFPQIEVNNQPKIKRRKKYKMPDNIEIIDLSKTKYLDDL